MRKFLRTAESNEEINITPMMDVVFIMLIFFIVTTSFVKESGIAISRTMQSSEPADVTNMALIKLAQDGFSINNQAVSLDGIEARLSQMRAANENLTAQLMADKSIKVNDLVKAVEQIKSAQIEQLSVSTF
ncbi:MAG: biopolymer transporter ExbD [Xanthomonadales bacterium]|nr:biopolymer transporter ExbD [Xanthomonadales bacterium]